MAISRILIFWILLLIGSLTLSTSYSRPSLVIARVDNQVITLRELENKIWFKKIIYPSAKNLGKKSLTYNVLDEIVETLMVKQEADRVGISVSNEELNNIVNQIKYSQPKLYD